MSVREGCKCVRRDMLRLYWRNDGRVGVHEGGKVRLAGGGSTRSDKEEGARRKAETCGA